MPHDKISVKRAAHEAKQLEVVELPVAESTTCVSCCPVTGNVAVGGNGVIRVFVLVQNERNWVEFEQFSDIKLDLVCVKVSICEDYVAAVSTDEVLVLKLNVAVGDEITQTDGCCDTLSESNQIKDDDNLFVCDFTTNAGSINNLSSQLELIQLSSVAEQGPIVEKMQESMEIFGPVAKLLCVSITVELTKATVREYRKLFGANSASEFERQSISTSADGKQVMASCVVLLYKKYIHLGGSIHSLQFVPTFQALKGEKLIVCSDSCTLLCPVGSIFYLCQVLLKVN